VPTWTCAGIRRGIRDKLVGFTYPPKQTCLKLYRWNPLPTNDRQVHDVPADAAAPLVVRLLACSLCSRCWTGVGCGLCCVGVAWGGSILPRKLLLLLLLLLSRVPTSQVLRGRRRV